MTCDRFALCTELTAVAKITKLTLVRSLLSRVKILTFFVSRIEKNKVPLWESAISVPEISSTGN